MTLTDTKPTNRELKLERIVDAPPELVFMAWTDPKHLVRWWGPRGFTTPECKLDLKVGGAVRIVMRAPDGSDYVNVGAFTEIVKPLRLAFTLANLGADGVARFENLNTVTFTPHEGKTLLQLNVEVQAVNAASAEGQLAGMREGWTSSLDRLDAVLDEPNSPADGSKIDLPADEPVINISRMFDAPRELVFKLMTDPYHLVHFWGPKGSSLPICEMNLTVGGLWRTVMQFPSGQQYRMNYAFVDIAPPEKLVFRDAPNDATEPLGELPPVRILTTIRFEDIGGKTRMTVQAQVNSIEDRDKHVQMGFADTISSSNDRFAAYLKTL
jgi:uncharacterized protein YndB with AHSA1/START domain